MIKIQMIGTLGADAEKKSVDGSKFTTFRLAHNETWTDQAGEEHSNVIWVDATLNDHPKVADFLKRGTQVFLEGYPSLRVYSSPKERCMKAGMTIRVQKVELLGGKVESVPRELVDENAVLHQVYKYYHVQGINAACSMIDKHGNEYAIDANGWVTPKAVQEQQVEQSQQTAQTAQTEQQQATQTAQTEQKQTEKKPACTKGKSNNATTKDGKDGKPF